MSDISDIVNSFPASVEELTDDDLDCLREIKTVLTRFDKTERFGVTMLHKHFDLGKDEVLLETHDAEQRSMTTKAISRDEGSFADLRATSWYLGKSTPVALGKCRSLWHAEEFK